MVVNKRSKNRRMRGSQTHGWGSKKKHRGTGNRGGKGMAGSGKRADSKKPSIWTEKYFGRFGFKRAQTKIDNTINLVTLEDILPTLILKKFATEESDIVNIDLTKISIDKLLSTGKVSKKLKITVAKASPKAVEKVSAAGGEVVVLSSPKEE